MKRNNQSNESYIKIEDVKEMNTNQETNKNLVQQGPKGILLKKIEYLSNKINSGGIQLIEYQKIKKELQEAREAYESMPYDPEAECTYHAGITELVQDQPTFRNNKFVLSRNAYSQWYIQDVSNEAGAIQLLLKLDSNGITNQSFTYHYKQFYSRASITKSYDLVLKESTFQAIPKPLDMGSGTQRLKCSGGGNLPVEDSVTLTPKAKAEKALAQNLTLLNI